jgi:hypothetical protein
MNGVFMSAKLYMSKHGFYYNIGHSGKIELSSTNQFTMKDE